MARCVLIVDSETGKLIDVAGNVREGGRFRKFVARMLSADVNPILDYGANGGDSLEISNGGYAGKEVNIKAETVKINGVPISTSGSSGSSANISGKPGEIDVNEVESSDPTKTVLQISIDTAIVEKLQQIDTALSNLSSYVKKSDIAAVVEDLSVEQSDTLEEVKGTLDVLVDRLRQLSE